MKDDMSVSQSRVSAVKFIVGYVIALHCLTSGIGWLETTFQVITWTLLTLGFIGVAIISSDITRIKSKIEVSFIFYLATTFTQIMVLYTLSVSGYYYLTTFTVVTTLLSMYYVTYRWTKVGIIKWKLY